MDALKLLAVGAALFAAAPAAAAPAAADPPSADPIAHWQAEIAEASSRFGVPEAWIVRVMRAESGGATRMNGRPITSRAGAMGLMQLMPGTWAMMRAQLGLGHDPHHPRDNILAGTAYLRAMYDRFGYPGLFAAYNAGPVRYQAHLASGRALPPETEAYLAKVAGQRHAPPRSLPNRPPPALFVVRGPGGEAVAPSSSRVPDGGPEAGPNRLFAVRVSR